MLSAHIPVVFLMAHMFPFCFLSKAPERFRSFPFFQAGFSKPSLAKKHVKTTHPSGSLLLGLDGGRAFQDPFGRQSLESLMKATDESLQHLLAVRGLLLQKAIGTTDGHQGMQGQRSGVDQGPSVVHQVLT